MVHGRPFESLARLAAPQDNCAIATRRIAAGTLVRFETGSSRTDRTILEGHRFAVRPIPKGQHLLSWGLPFGLALSDIAAGCYVCNEPMLAELELRGADIDLPPQPNFEDLELEPFPLDEDQFTPAPPLDRSTETDMFQGFRRPGSRGVGTRNYLVILGTSSQSAAYSRLLAQRVQSRALPSNNLDGVVAVAHTEGGGAERPNNLELVLRSLAGFMVHPNVGAVLAVDYGSEPANNALLRQFAQQHDYALADVPHHFLSLRGSLADGLAEGERIVAEWLELLDAQRRTRESLAHLKVALQCGGSDAFSGVSGNPLAGWVAREIVRRGGAANLAETDELIGAESYVLARVRDLETCREFLSRIDRYKQLVAWHGLTAEGNPSGGNRLRGLYNITLKSIGAAMKRHPEVRLDRVIDYAAPMSHPGFYFMDSPGNDLESVAGQVASGANLIFFTTGNGSVTNFPFVPTLKVMTTTRRFKLLEGEMDVNAGLYLDGTGMEELGRRMFELTVATASGRVTKGEKAGHYQVSIWRDWRQTDFSRTESLQSAPALPGTALPLEIVAPPEEPTFNSIQREGVCATELVNLILPTSLCSGQIARMAAERLNRKEVGGECGVSRAVAPVHTEGCGSSGISSDALYTRTMLGYLTHPNVAHALLLEHGCEKMHNARLQRQLQEHGIEPGRYGFASVQLDGGIERVLDRIEAWFTAALEAGGPAPEREVGIGSLRLGLFSTGRLSEPEAAGLLELVRTMLGCRASVVVPQSASLLESPAFAERLLGSTPARAGLGYGQTARGPGFFVMESPSRHAVEALTGLGATGVHLILARIEDHPLPAHPLVHMLQFGAGQASREFSDDLDIPLEEPPGEWPRLLLDKILRTASREYTPKYSSSGYSDFQLSRGLLGVSM